MKRRERGFTLLEVIVAFALLGLGLALLLGVLSNAGRQMRQAEDVSRVSLHAQSLLAEMGMGEVLQEGQRSGEWEEGRYRWTLRIAPYRDANLPPMQLPGSVAPTRLMQLDLEMRWGEQPHQQLHWTTLRRVPTRQPG